jgi:carbonic anhydrase
MSDTTLAELLERNARHTEGLPEGHFDGVERRQEPAAVSVCCSDSRVSQEGMFSVEDPGWLFTPSTIGNQVWDVHDGERVVDGSVLYPIVNTDTRVVAVVGHTGCGAVTAALEAVEEGEALPPGIAKWVELLVPVVEDGLAELELSAAEEDAVDRLVEYNVDRQVEFLRESDGVPDSEAVFGFVYDFQAVYGDGPGRVYLVNADGETDPEALRERVPEGFGTRVRRLTEY